MMITQSSCTALFLADWNQFFCRIKLIMDAFFTHAKYIKNNVVKRMPTILNEYVCACDSFHSARKECIWNSLRYSIHCNRAYASQTGQVTFYEYMHFGNAYNVVHFNLHIFAVRVFAVRYSCCWQLLNDYFK